MGVKVEYFVIIFVVFSIVPCSYCRVLNSTVKTVERLLCYDCEETYLGPCAKGEDVRTTLCLGHVKSCSAAVFYNPFNLGYGGKYTYKRGCSICDAADVPCEKNLTINGYGILTEYMGPVTLCPTRVCNNNEMSSLTVESPHGMKEFR